MIVLNTVSSNVGKIIRELRKRENLSIESLAHEAYISTNFLGDVERGKKQPSLETLESLLMALNVSFVEFFSYIDAGVPAKQKSRSDKILSELSNFSDAELKAVHTVIRQLKNFKT